MNNNLSKLNISLIVPTYNRSYTLKETIPSYYAQSYLKEIIFVDDCSSDDTIKVINHYISKYPETITVVLRNRERKGVVYSRREGYQKARGEYILFCDDDEILESNYSHTCLAILERSKSIGAISGRRIYQIEGETNSDSISRFNETLKDIPYFNFRSFCFNYDANLKEESSVPLTNSAILTKREYLIKYGLDLYYDKGNSYREESDYQATLISNGLDIIVTNKTYSIHLDLRYVSSGGNRLNRFSRFYWNSLFSWYFADKHYLTYKKNYECEMPSTKLSFKLGIFFYQFYILFIRPIKRLFV